VTRVLEAALRTLFGGEYAVRELETAVRPRH
jgi:hypothetical protein